MRRRGGHCTRVLREVASGVYLHTVAAELKGEKARLEEEKASAESEGERLDVRVTELSDPGRVRTLARKGLQMQDPGGKDIATYGNDG